MGGKSLARADPVETDTLNETNGMTTEDGMIGVQ